MQTCDHVRSRSQQVPECAPAEIWQYVPMLETVNIWTCQQVCCADKPRKKEEEKNKSSAWISPSSLKWPVGAENRNLDIFSSITFQGCQMMIVKNSRMLQLFCDLCVRNLKKRKKKKKGVLVTWSGVISSSSRPSKKNIFVTKRKRCTSQSCLPSFQSCDMWKMFIFFNARWLHFFFFCNTDAVYALWKTQLWISVLHWHHNWGGNGQFRSQPHIWLLHRTADRAFGCAKTGHPYVKKIISPTNT